MKRVSFSLELEVTDEAALIAAAKSRMVEEGVDWDEEEMDAATAVRWLLDPSVSLPGTEIQDSAAEVH